MTSTRKKTPVKVVRRVAWIPIVKQTIETPPLRQRDLSHDTYRISHLNRDRKYRKMTTRV